MRESASGPMPVVYDAIPDDDCVVSVYPMIPPNKEFAADMPKTASCLLKRKSGKGLGTRAAPGGGAKSMKCGLETADAAWGRDVVTKGQEEVTRGRKDHKEVTNNGEPRGPEGTGKRGAAPQGETTTKGDTPAKARDASRPVKSGSRSKLC